MSEKFKILNEKPELENRKLNKCDTPGCDGKGNTRHKFKTHTSSKNCPNKPNKKDQMNENEESKDIIKLKKENTDPTELTAYLSSVTNNNQSFCIDNQDIETTNKNFAKELFQLKSKNNAYKENSQDIVS